MRDVLGEIQNDMLRVWRKQVCKKQRAGKESILTEVVYAH